MVVGDTEISVMEYNYTYYTQVQTFYSSYADYLSYFQLDTEKPLKDQPCTVTETEQTWADYFMDQTDDILQQVVSCYNAAKAEGMKLSEDYEMQIEAFVLSATQTASSVSLSLDDYLSKYYGNGLNEKYYREFLARRFLASQYCDEKLGAIVHSDSDFEAYYAENADTIDRVDFRIYTLTEDSLPENVSAETETEVEEAVKSLAESFAASITSEEDFKQKAVEFAPESQKASYQSDNATLAANISGSDLANTTMSSWLFDKSRVAGEVSVHKTATGAYSVCYYLSRHRDEHPLVSMRHLLLAVTAKEDGTSDAQQVYEEIQGLYSQWEQSGFTEKSFTELVTAHTDDPGSKETGGLYESFAYGTMVSEINDWLYAEERQLNDTAIIKTSFGYHIVWFAGYGEIAWKNECLPGLQDADYYELMESLEEYNPISFRADYRDVLGNDY